MSFFQQTCCLLPITGLWLSGQPGMPGRSCPKTSPRRPWPFPAHSSGSACGATPVRGAWRPTEPGGGGTAPLKLWGTGAPSPLDLGGGWGAPCSLVTLLCPWGLPWVPRSPRGGGPQPLASGASDLGAHVPQPSDEENSDNSSECVVCLSDLRDTLILPCRHLCLCNSCADTLRYQASNCPICRLREWGVRGVWAGPPRPWLHLREVWPGPGGVGGGCVQGAAWTPSATKSFSSGSTWDRLGAVQSSSVAQSCPTVHPHGLQHARLPCPSPSPGAYSDSCPLSW